MPQQVAYDPEKDELSQQKQRSIYQSRSSHRGENPPSPPKKNPERAGSCYLKQKHAQSLQDKMRHKQAEA